MKKVVDLIAGQDLQTISPHHLILDALRRMESLGIHSLLVFGEDQFLGIVTMTDVATSIFGRGVFVRDIMTSAENVVFVSPQDSIETCSNIIKSKHIHHLVVKDGGRVVGVVSSIDLMVAKDQILEEAAELARDMPAS